ncbi:hypothetical protein ACL02T_30040 [Pseudonocardia sp. RS010]|uniref:hypothetical protein n=1 Tax=Pseudonocardia sp. RS010 TaxID=3385979 RepID=UPI0039A266C7
MHLAPGMTVRFDRSDRPDPVLGTVTRRVGLLLEIRTDDGRLHHRTAGAVQQVPALLSATRTPAAAA